MNRKAIFLSKRLDRIAPKSDRTLIRIALCLAVVVLLLSCALLLATYFPTDWLGDSLRPIGIAILCVAAAAQIAGLLLIIKETIRNRFYSAVWILILHIATTALFVTAAVLFALAA